MNARRTRFATVSLDADSTLSNIEGIDWLAARRGPDIAAQVAALTESAMAGEIALDAVYGARLALAKPSRSDIDALAEAYIARMAAGARECVAQMRAAGVRVLIVSGGIRDALLPMARELGIADDDTFGVPIRFSPAGDFDGFDEESPLARQSGKADLLGASSFAAQRPILHVGDGATDSAARGAVDAFAAFTGFVRRAAVVAEADYVVGSFAELVPVVFGGPLPTEPATR